MFNSLVLIGMTPDFIFCLGVVYLSPESCCNKSPVSGECWSRVPSYSRADRLESSVLPGYVI